jgi:tRNA threonylcarbamoyladenosine biosynthesis protein TsaB
MSGPLLVIDASTYRGTVALVEGDRILAENEAQMRGTDAERLMPAVSAMLSDAGVTVNSLDGIICGEGPGSFTSLRIAASIAKGLSVAADRPLYAVSSLLLIVAAVRPALAPGGYLALLDAMRGEWFGVRVDLVDGEVVAVDAEPALMDASMIARVVRDERRIVVGPGQARDVAPRAAGAARLLGRRVARLDAERGAGASRLPALGVGESPAALPADVQLVHPVDRTTWEPLYGRLAEAQVKWEKLQGRPLVV